MEPTAVIRVILMTAAVISMSAAVRPTKEPGANRASPGCAADTLGARLLVLNLQKVATGTAYPYPIMRDSLRIPAVAASEVVLQSDSSLCADAAAVYDSVLVARGGQPNPSRNVIVVRVGAAYAVQDPEESRGEWRISMMLDSALRFLSLW